MVDYNTRNNGVDGTDGNDQMNPGYTDAQGNQIDGSDGNNDVIVGQLGNDVINGGQGNDTIYGDGSPEGSSSDSVDLSIAGAQHTMAVWGFGSISADVPIQNWDGIFKPSGYQFTLKDHSPVAVGVRDDSNDTQFETFGKDYNLPQVITNTVSFAGENYSPGTEIAPSDTYEIVDSKGNTFKIHLVDLVSWTDGSGIISDKPLTAGETYSLVGRLEHKFISIDYDNIASSYNVPEGTGQNINNFDTADGGNDIINGGDGADMLYGGGGSDTIKAGAGDFVDGGTAGSDYDVLDLTGLGKVEIVNQSTDNDNDSTSGSVNIIGDNGSVTGTIQFKEIEDIKTDPQDTNNGIVDGKEAAENMGPGYTDGDGDKITDGDDDIEGNGGADRIDGGEGADFIDGGEGDDDIILGAGDAAMGGTGDDDFTFDPSVSDTGGISIEGGLDGTNGNPDDFANEDDGDTLDLRGLKDVVVTLNPNDPTAGTASYTNDAGQTVPITFKEIENILTDDDGGNGNSAPVVGEELSGQVTEDDGVVSANLLVNAYDPDGDDLSMENIVVKDDLGNYVAFQADAQGNISVDAGQFDYLNDGEARTVTATYDVVDANGASTSTQAQLVVTGITDGDGGNGGNGGNVINGTNGDDCITGTDGDDLINLLAGDDEVNSSAGDDILNGGEGCDTVVYEGSVDDYSFYLNNDGNVVVVKPNGQGTDTLVDIEQGVFTDEPDMVHDVQQAIDDHLVM